jgi:hypothetical protein
VEYVKNWYDHSEGVISVKVNRENTVLLFDIKEPHLGVFKDLDTETGFNFVVANTLTDLVAIPAILAVVDPSDVLKNEMTDFFNLVADYFGPHDCKYIFLCRSSVRIPNILKGMIIDRPKNFNKELLLNTIKGARESNVVPFQSEFSLIKHFHQT